MVVVVLLVVLVVTLFVASNISYALIPKPPGMVLGKCLEVCICLRTLEDVGNTSIIL